MMEDIGNSSCRMISLDWFRIHDPKDLATWGLTLVGTVVLTYVLIFTNGNVHAGAAFLLGLAVILITLLRVDWGLYLFLLLVFLFDQFPVPGMESFTFQIGYFNNLNTVGYLPRLEEGVVTPMELHLIFLLFVAFVVHAKGKDLVPVKIPARIPALLFILALVSSLVYGWVRGGNFIISLWETRALAYLGIMIILIPRIIKTEKQLQTLFWFFIIGISFKAVQGVIRFSSLGFTFGSWSNIHETFTNHEDPVFFITLFILLIALSLFGGYPKQQRALLGLLGLILLGFIAAQRRATYASFMATIAAFAVLLPKKERLMFIRPLAVFLLLFALYLGIFWNTDYGRLSTVALQFKATVLGEGGIRGEQDYSSTLYREQENFNIAYTFRTFPILGVGFGFPFEQPIRLWNINFDKLGPYIPHNQILWVFLKTGIIGGFCFWFFFNSFVFYGTQVFSKLSNPYLRAVCAVCVVSVVNQLVVSYVDMQLTWYRNMVHLGTLMGLIPVCQRLDRNTG